MKAIRQLDPTTPDSRFPTLAKALEYASSEYSEYGVRFDPSLSTRVTVRSKEPAETICVAELERLRRIEAAARAYVLGDGSSASWETLMLVLQSPVPANPGDAEKEKPLTPDNAGGFAKDKPSFFGEADMVQYGIVTAIYEKPIHSKPERI